MFTRGGARKGAGRKKGGKNKDTLERDRIYAAMRQRILNKADKILDAQFSIATGQQFLYRITTRIGTKGQTIREKPELVTDPEEISAYLNGDFEDEGDTVFYYITTKEPNNNAIDSMFNRAFGKPQESVDLTSNGDKLKGVNLIGVDLSKMNYDELRKMIAAQKEDKDTQK